jgi:hypothetical protein
MVLWRPQKVGALGVRRRLGKVLGPLAAQVPVQQADPSHQNGNIKRERAEFDSSRPKYGAKRFRRKP